TSFWTNQQRVPSFESVRVPNGLGNSAIRNLRHSLVSSPCFIPVVPASRAAQRHEKFASIRTRVRLPNPLDTTRACYAASQGTNRTQTKAIDLWDRRLFSYFYLHLPVRKVRRTRPRSSPGMSKRGKPT